MHNDGSLLDAQISFGLERIAAYARKKQWAIAEQYGLTPTQIAILELAAARTDGIRLTKAAAQIGVSQPTASDAAGSLVAKQLLERAPDPGDRRAQRLTPTKQGAQLVSRLLSGHAAVTAAVPQHRRASLFAALAQTIATLQRGGEVPIQRMCLTCSQFERCRHDDAKLPHHCRYLDQPIGPLGMMLDCPDHIMSADLEPA
ncbi:DNA-binding MarR family transcriptional regulator [Porphyrobacter sp. MBR-155]|jgi:DNA-binding MarR family transcriptional regulator|uniref:MarR family winged helix-turn-helix transcriptional regulator n=1 Tax=Porphyrobacter sp. MBR-155 TaxID=3156464 RepID=UPI00339529D1